MVPVADTPPQSPLTLFVSHRGELVDHARRILGDRAGAEDVVQEAWLRFDEVARLHFLHEPLGYLHRIVHNLALDGRRRRLREGRVLRGDALEAVDELAPDGRPSPESAALYSDAYRQMLVALAELPDRTRIALEMHRLGGAKLREIAALLGISVPLAHVLVNAGVRHCRQRLEW